uniref:C2H2-type domain-containing protein n=1 Tax=Anopheles atroparvus TaxID=41427 RepID=A0AAG5D5R6_ANOAO
MSAVIDVDIDSPFVKKEKCCKVCGATEGPMESIFCSADDTAMLNKIYKCTRVEVTPVCGLISPICVPCHRRIDEFDENAQPKVIEFVIKTELDHDTLEYDPLNVGNVSDPMGIDVKSEDNFEEHTGRTRRPTKRKLKKRAIQNVDSYQVRSLPIRRRPGRPPKVKLESPEPEIISMENVPKEKSVHQVKKEEELEEQEVTEKRCKSRLRKRRKKIRTSSQDDDSSEENNFDSCDGELPYGEHDSNIGDEDGMDVSDSDSREERDPDLGKNRQRRGHRQRRQKSIKKKGGIPEQCEVCGKTVSYMREHMRLHRIEKQHPCPHCDRTFVQANNLKYHIRKHLGEKPFACKQCEKQFYCEAHLKSHMRVHGPQGLFQCDVCPKSFNQECNLKKHLRVHTGEKPYSCDTCGKRFNSTSNLRNHSRLHSDERPLTCDHCSKSFVDVHHLQRHIRVHTGERPYICHVCTYSFYCQNGLMDHLKTHIEKKSFKLD